MHSGFQTVIPARSILTRIAGVVARGFLGVSPRDADVLVPPPLVL
jgi:hypothetical protein